MISIFRYGFERKAALAREAYLSNQDFLAEELTRFRVKCRISERRWRPVEIVHFLHWAFTFTAERSGLRRRLKAFVLAAIGEESAAALMAHLDTAADADAGAGHEAERAAYLLQAIDRMEVREQRYTAAWSADIEQGQGLLPSSGIAMPGITQALIDGVFNNGGKRKRIEDRDSEVDGLVSDVVCTAAVMFQKMA